MSWQTVSPSQVPATPWRNGGGVTRELLAWPSAADWRVRLSVADIEGDGPFSRFEGIERWFAVLEGTGVALRVGGQFHELTPASAPLRFDGAVPVDCALLRGTTRDFNLMAAPGAARLQRVQGRAAFSGAAGALVALYAHRGAARLACGAEAIRLAGPLLVWQLLGAPASIMVEADDALWMEVAL